MSSEGRLAVAGVVAGAATMACASAFVGSAPHASSPALRASVAPATSSTAPSPPGMSAAGVAAGLIGTLGVVQVAKNRKRTERSRVARYQQAPQKTSQTAVAERKKGDLSGALPDCPPTIWNAEDIDIQKLPPVKETAPLIIDAAELGDELKKGTETEWFVTQREKIMAQLQDHGAIWFRNFESTKDAEGFRAFYEALQLNPCLDPIHTSGLRAMEVQKHAVYEAVNKPSLAQHFVGLHNESTFVKTATYGAFVCFEPASEGGGEFFIADGAKIVNDLDKDVLKRIYENKVRISVSNLDLNFLGGLPDGFRQQATATPHKPTALLLVAHVTPLPVTRMSPEQVSDYLQDLILKVVAPKFEMDLEMIFGADQSNPYRLQAIEHAQSPINKHPVTGQPVWFCNLHNHSRYLRDRRPCTVPEVGMTDVYSGDLSTIPYDDVRHINEVCERNLVTMPMKKGDVVLLDNYRVLHGRQTFKGDRKHAVTWFESCGEPLQREDASKDKPDDFMNTLINKTLV